MDSLNRHLAQRAEVVIKCLKYPNVQDYAVALAELDQRQHIVLTHTCIDLRNNYAILFDIVKKNFAHLSNPKGEESRVGML